MDLTSVRPFFKRYTKQRMLELCKEYKMNEGAVKSSSTKDDLCRILCQAVTNGRITVKDLERLDIQRCQSCTNKWIVYNLVRKGSQFALNDPERLRETFEKKLKVYLKCRVGVLPVKNALWLRISLHGGNSKLLLSPANTFYMVYVPGSSYILLSTLKVAHKVYILKALENLFECEDITELDLTGKKVGSLCDLVLNAKSQGAFSSFALNQVDANPLSRKRKRGVSDILDIGNNNEDDKVFNEHWLKDKKSKRQTMNAFGPNIQPSLEKLEFKMHTRFRGAKNLLDNTTVQCTVKFCGTNVLEGIKGLAQHGLASHPLPSHVANIHSMARNHFVLTEKK